MNYSVKELIQKLKVNSQKVVKERERVGLTEGKFNTSEDLEKLYSERETILQGLTSVLGTHGEGGD